MVKGTGGYGRTRNAPLFSLVLLPVVNMSTFVLLTRSSYSSGPQIFNVKFPTSDQVFEFMIWKALFPHLSNSIPFAFFVKHMFPLNILLELK